jgi:hypothetical protein
MFGMNFATAIPIFRMIKISQKEGFSYNFRYRLHDQLPYFRNSLQFFGFRLKTFVLKFIALEVQSSPNPNLKSKNKELEQEIIGAQGLITRLASQGQKNHPQAKS